MTAAEPVLENPYFEAVAGGVTVGPNRADWSDRAVDLLERREKLVETYAWAIPNHEAIETILANKPILEVGAGAGYWAWCVRQLDESAIAATDIDPPADRWTHVLEWNAVDIVRWINDHVPEASLLLIWPPDDGSMAADALEAYAGDTLLYVGEGRGGCTADFRFHQLLFEEWRLEGVVEIPTYPTDRDRLEVWSR